MDPEPQRVADLDALPTEFAAYGSCDGCVYWEAPDEFARGFLDPYLKRDWIAEVLAGWGNCALLDRRGGRVVDFAQYAPARFYPFERLAAYPSGPVSDDAVLLACLHVRVSDARGRGVGTALLQAVVDDLTARGERAVETFARRDGIDNPSGPASFYLARGFRVLREVGPYPLLRQDLVGSEG